jgi:heme/copper-type cytochrome/quinol oxidase subunit 3
LAAEWILVTTPNTILSGASVTSSNKNIANAYSIMQRIEPGVYATVSLILSSFYIYYAYIMFRRYGDKAVRRLLIRLLYSNLLLIALAWSSLIAEYAGGGIIQTGYVCFFFSVVCFSGLM